MGDYADSAIAVVECQHMQSCRGTFLVLAANVIFEFTHVGKVIGGVTSRDGVGLVEEKSGPVLLFGLGGEHETGKQRQVGHYGLGVLSNDGWLARVRIICGCEHGLDVRARRELSARHGGALIELVMISKSS